MKRVVFIHRKKKRKKRGIHAKTKKPAKKYRGQGR